MADYRKVKAFNGHIIHLIPADRQVSLCGNDPSGDRSGWWRVDEKAKVTCKKCAQRFLAQRNVDG